MILFFQGDADEVGQVEEDTELKSITKPAPPENLPDTDCYRSQKEHLKRVVLLLPLKEVENSSRF